MKTLIVEDSATLCAIYSQYLDGSGLEVTTVETLADAKAALVDWHPHLVLLDIEGCLPIVWVECNRLHLTGKERTAG